LILNAFLKKNTTFHLEIDYEAFYERLKRIQNLLQPNHPSRTDAIGPTTATTVAPNVFFFFGHHCPRYF
jgi:hypothetical protein